MIDLHGISNQLRPLLDFELSRGNGIERVDRPAGTRCPLAVILKKPLDFKGYADANGFPSGVSVWENRDAHYPIEAGYVCEKTNQALAGPIG
jgi:hypothetical protein